MVYMECSVLQKLRYQYHPYLPPDIHGTVHNITASVGKSIKAEQDADRLQKIFPNTYGKPLLQFSTKHHNPNAEKKRVVGVVLSGGQAPGGHNVIAGLFDALKAANPANTLLGFLGGPAGLINNTFITIDTQYIEQFRNTGGFDIIGSGRTKIESTEQFASTLQTCIQNNIDSIVVIGGDDSNTNAALLAEYFQKHSKDIQVIGVPKTIDGDLKNTYVETSFGFDTATKVYAELIGNIQKDANSAKKILAFY